MLPSAFGLTIQFKLHHNMMHNPSHYWWQCCASSHWPIQLPQQLLYQQGQHRCGDRYQNLKGQGHIWQTILTSVKWKCYHSQDKAGYLPCHCPLDLTALKHRLYIDDTSTNATNYTFNVWGKLLICDAGSKHRRSSSMWPDGNWSSPDSCQTVLVWARDPDSCIPKRVFLS